MKSLPSLNSILKVIVVGLALSGLGLFAPALAGPSAPEAMPLPHVFPLSKRELLTLPLVD